MRASHRAERRRAGFSLLEAVIALAILGVGLLALAAMQLHAMRGGESGRRTSEAAALAQARMERLQRATWNDPALTPGGGWKPAETISSPGQSDVEYELRWRVADVVAGSTRAIDVQVNWSEPERGSRSLAISSMRFNREDL